MDQDKSRFEEQRKDLDQSPEKDGAIRYEMKNVDEVPRKSIRVTTVNKNPMKSY